MRKKTLFFALAVTVLFVLARQACGGYEFVRAWGCEGSSAGQFDVPFGVAVDRNGDVYVTDFYNHRIQKFSSDGTYITQWGDEGTGSGQFKRPHHIAVDSAGYVYVADYGNHRIQKFNGDGKFVTMWDISTPYGIALDSSDYVYVSSHFGDSISKFTSDGTYVTGWGGGHGSGNYQFKYPNGVAVGPLGNIYVTDLWNHRLQIFSDEGVYLDTWDYYDIAYDVTVDPFGYVYLTNNDDDSIYKVQKYASDGTLVTEWGISGSSDGQFSEPYSIALDSSGYVYVSDGDNYRIQQFIPEPMSIFLLSVGGLIVLSKRTVSREGK